MTLAWPNGARAAAAFTFDVDAESCVLAHDPASSSRMSLMSHQAYGARAGVPRLLRLLERQGITATFFVPGFTADTYPDLVRQIRDGGHEIAHHGYLHEAAAGMGPDQEARMIDRGLDALDKVAGVRPEGYRAPMWELNYHTAGLLCDRGFAYDSSLMDSDVPYLLAEHEGHPRTLVEIPIHWSLDDWEQYGYIPEVSGSGLIESPAKVLEMWTLELEAFHREGGCFVLTNHPFLSGRPSRSAALERLVERMESLDGLWLTTLGEIARHTREAATQVRHFPQPSVEAPTFAS